MELSDPIIEADAQILVTGAGGFIGRRVVANLLERGFTNIRCLARPTSNPDRFREIQKDDPGKSRLEIYPGNLLSPEDCLRVSQNAQVVFHLAAGRGVKSFPDAFLNSAVTTRNLIEACLRQGTLKRFVNVSSFSVYTNRNKPRGRILDETCPLEIFPAQRGDAYCFAKVKQEEMLFEYGKKHQLPFVSVRPGVVYGPGNEGIHGRVGIGSFGIFLHLGGSNKLPLTYVDNCAEAIVLAGLVKGIDGEVFNVVDDDLPSSRRFLRLYKKHVGYFRSIYVPRFLSYYLCDRWEKYANWSQGQLPNSFNRKDWHAAWKKSFYTNEKIKRQLGWKQKISTGDALKKHFECCRERKRHA